MPHDSDEKPTPAPALRRTLLVQAGDDRFRVSEESHALAWVPAVGLDALTDEESVLRMTRKWVEHRGNGNRWLDPV